MGAWWWWKSDWRNRVASWIAWRLPRRVVGWCAVRVAAHATTGEYSDTIVPDLTALDAIQRWEEAAYQPGGILYNELTEAS